MIKNFIITSIITFFILFLNIITAIAINNNNENLKETVTSNLSSFININYKQEDVKNPIIPNKETREVNLTITYYVQSSGKLLSKLNLFLLKNKQVNIKLSISNQPDWCEASLSQDTISATVSDKEQNQTTKLAITLKENAPAYNTGNIIINASTSDIKGIFGIVTQIAGFEKEYNIPIMVSYISSIKIEPKSYNFKLTPYNYTVIPINITNIGNGRTAVFAEIENVSKNWVTNITDLIIINPNNSGTIYLTIKTDNKYNQSLIKLKFTPAYANNTEEKGESQNIILTIENDGSYVEKSSLSTDLTYFIIALVVIVLIIVFIFVLIQKKK